MERLDKFLCDSGIGSRSQVRQMLKAGRVTVDGVPIRDGAAKIDPEQRQVALDGRNLSGHTTLLVMLNKPAGYVTATEDRREPTVMELLPPELRNRGLKPVGRLDKATEGLLLLTNDGALLHSLIAPKRQVSKLYYVRHEGQAGPADVQAFADGLTLGDGTVCRSALLEPLGPGESLVTVQEGKYHQVRRMMAARGLPVLYLERRQEGPWRLDGLERGQVRLLEPPDRAILTNF